jgi:hypothetical protein
MRHIEFARRSNEENKDRKEHKVKFYEQEKLKIRSQYENYNEDARYEIFNPETDHPEDAPDITKEGYSFAKNRFFIARNFFDKTHIEWTYHMFKFQEFRKQYYREEHIISENFDDKGSGLDSWVSKGMPFPNYGETILLMYQKKIEDLFGFRLVPTYSYGRTYERHSRLLSHTDRPSCEISATFPISYNTDDNKPWTIWVRNDMNYCGMANKESWDLTMGNNFLERDNCVPVVIEPGDALFYQGSNVIHWRDRLAGDNARQIFIHYIHKDGPMYRDFPQLAYDGRPSIYHGTGSKTGRAWEEANMTIQEKKNYWRYGNAAITDPFTGEPCAKGHEKHEYERPENQFPASKTGG